MTGRPTIRTEKMIDEIIERVTAGEPLAQVLRTEGMPGVSTFYAWLDSDENLSGRFARARKMGHDAIATDAMKIADMPPAYVQSEGGIRIDPGDVANRKLQIETRLKLLAKWDARYAEKQQVEHSGAGGGAIQIAVVTAVPDETTGD